MSLVIVGTLLGNVAAVANAFRRVGGHPIISCGAQDIRSASALVLPGVGAFDDGCSRLHRAGIFTLLQDRAAAGIPILGICLGMQLLADGSEEGESKGLGLIPGYSVRFRPETVPNGRIPHMGWNRVRPETPNVFLEAQAPDRRFYFVHSYHLQPVDPGHVLATSEYGNRFVSIVQKRPVIGVQFHPEKSLRWGLDFLKRFLNHA